MKKPELSVIMGNYNKGSYVAEAVESILSQSSRPKELIIIDDGSTDDSLKILESYASREPLIRFYKNEKNLGLFNTLTLLMTHITGDYFFSAASDDIVMPGLFEKAMTLLKKYPGAGLCCFNTMSIDERSRPLTRWLPEHIGVPEYIPPGKILEYMRKGWTITPPIYKLSSVQEAGGFIPSAGLFADWFTSILIAFAHGVCYVDEVLAGQRMLPTQYSKQYSADPNRFIKTMGNALYLLKKDEYRKKVPGQFIEYCYDYFSFLMNGTIKSTFYTYQRDFLNRLRELKKNPGPFDNIQYGLLTLIMKLERHIALLYCRRNYRKELDEASYELNEL